MSDTSSEQRRVEAELAREMAEVEREKREQTRRRVEEDRVIAESSRTTSEHSRELAEDAREVTERYRQELACCNPSADSLPTPGMSRSMIYRFIVRFLLCCRGFVGHDAGGVS